MSDETVLAEADKPKMPIIVGTLVVSCVLLIVIVLGVQQFFGFAVRDLVTERQLAPVNPQLKALHVEEARRLGHYQWVDKQKGVLRIPVDRAMELTLREWAARPEGASGHAPAPSLENDSK